MKDKNGIIWLLAAALCTVVLWHVPYGNFILYPFTILVTWFHEMGHGLCALILGGTFERLVIYADGSGTAFYHGPVAFGRLGQVLVSSAGPLGPSMAGALVIFASRKESSARLALFLLGTALLLSTALWVRSLFGFVLVPLMGLAILAIAVWASTWVRNFAVQFLGVQACISVYHQVNYLFTKSVIINGELTLSDTGSIAEQLWLPYWIWGALIAALSLLLLLWSLLRVYAENDAEIT